MIGAGANDRANDGTSRTANLQGPKNLCWITEVLALLCFHIPRCRIGYHLLSHSHISLQNCHRHWEIKRGAASRPLTLSRSPAWLGLPFFSRFPCLREPPPVWGIFDPAKMRSWTFSGIRPFLMEAQTSWISMHFTPKTSNSD